MTYTLVKKNATSKKWPSFFVRKELPILRLKYTEKGTRWMKKILNIKFKIGRGTPYIRRQRPYCEHVFHFAPIRKDIIGSDNSLFILKNVRGHIFFGFLFWKLIQTSNCGETTLWWQKNIKPYGIAAYPALISKNTEPTESFGEKWNNS